jgi:hypothetical protein
VEQEVVVERDRVGANHAAPNRHADLHLGEHGRVDVGALGIAQVRQASNERVDGIDLVLCSFAWQLRVVGPLRTSRREVRIAEVADVANNNVMRHTNVVGDVAEIGW